MNLILCGKQDEGEFHMFSPKKTSPDQENNPSVFTKQNLQLLTNELEDAGNMGENNKVFPSPLNLLKVDQFLSIFDRPASYPNIIVFYSMIFIRGGLLPVQKCRMCAKAHA